MRIFLDSIRGFSPALSALLLVTVARCAPAPCNENAIVLDSTPSSSTDAAESPTPTVPYASDNSNQILWTPDSKIVPEPVRGSLGAPSLNTYNLPLELQNADLLAPPTTDNGDM